MGYRRNPNTAAPNLVNNSIIADDEFPHVRILILRHYSSQFRESFQAINGESDTFSKIDGVGR